MKVRLGLDVLSHIQLKVQTLRVPKKTQFLTHLVFLFLIYRLDRLTSGLLLFGRNPKKAREMEQQIRTRQVQKEYVCRVDGEFPT